MDGDYEDCYWGKELKNNAAWVCFKYVHLNNIFNFKLYFL